jgi:CRISPR/Cas system-associated endoribonuclease Cas2
MTKSGCCWHQYSTFVVEDNKPKVVEIIEEVANSVEKDSEIKYLLKNLKNENL